MIASPRVVAAVFTALVAGCGGGSQEQRVPSRPQTAPATASPAGASPAASPAAASPSPDPVATPVPGASAQPICAQEPGGDIGLGAATAAALPVGVTDGCLTPEDDGDLYRLAAPADAALGFTVSMTLAGPPGGCLSFYDHRDGRPPAAESCEAAGALVEGWVHLGAGQSILMKVDHQIKRGNRRSMGYRLTVTTRSLPDADEPNDTPEQATQLTLGQPHQGLIATPVGSEQIDHYAIEVPRGTSELQVDVTGSDPEVRWQVEARPVGGVERRALHAEPGQELHGKTPIRRGGKWIVKLENGRATLHDSGGRGRGPAPALWQPYQVTITAR